MGRLKSDPEVRFFSKIVDTSGCWLWGGGKNPEGYGRFFMDGRHIGPHRYSYELFQGKIPEGYYLDHLCRVPSCVHPNHLEPVTNRENQRRGNNVTKRKKNGLPMGIRRHGRKYKARIMVDGKNYYLGLYHSVDQAEKALTDHSGSRFGT